MSCVRLSVCDEGGGKIPGIPSVETESIDDYEYFRDAVHERLEKGEWGGVFPLLLRLDGDRWAVSQIEGLRRELSAIAEAFKTLAPRPHDGNWRGKLAFSGRKCASLYEVYIDAEGEPLLGKMIALCDAALKVGKAIVKED